MKAPLRNNAKRGLIVIIISTLQVMLKQQKHGNCSTTSREKSSPVAVCCSTLTLYCDEREALFAKVAQNVTSSNKQTLKLIADVCSFVSDNSAAQTNGGETVCYEAGTTNRH